MKRVIAVWVVLMLCSVNFALAATPNFQGLGDLSGGSFNSGAYGVSSDGQVVVGNSISASGYKAFRWTSAGGMVSIGPGYANAVSADGQVIAGLNGGEAFRWTNLSGMISLGDLPGGSFESGATGVSSDGQVVVGYSSSTSGYEAFRWISAGGMIGLGDLSGGSFESVANGISSDGQVIVGRGTSGSGTEAFRWTNDGGMVGLGDLPGGYFNSWATAVSSDGSIVIGTSSSTASFASYENATEAFRWTSVGGMVGLGDLPGGDFHSSANAISSDGSIVAGQSISALGYEAFIWDNVNGMQNLKDMLIDKCGLDLTGWQLWSATGISADGLTIIGWGYNPSGDQEAWRATIPAWVIPCTTPPDFELSVTPTILWPANHKMIKITPSWMVTDLCDPSPQVSLVDITMNEPGNPDDIQISDDGSIYLCATRSGNSKARIYTLTYQACDSSANCTTKTATVTVPHDNRK